MLIKDDVAEVTKEIEANVEKLNALSQKLQNINDLHTQIEFKEQEN